MIIVSCGTHDPHWHSTSCPFHSSISSARDIANSEAPGARPPAGSYNDLANQKILTNNIQLRHLPSLISLAILQLDRVLVFKLCNRKTTRRRYNHRLSALSASLIGYMRIDRQSASAPTRIPDFTASGTDLSFQRQTEIR